MEMNRWRGEGGAKGGEQIGGGMEGDKGMKERGG